MFIYALFCFGYYLMFQVADTTCRFCIFIRDFVSLGNFEKMNMMSEIFGTIDDANYEETKSRRVLQEYFESQSKPFIQYPELPYRCQGAFFTLKYSLPYWDIDKLYPKHTIRCIHRRVELLETPTVSPLEFPRIPANSKNYRGEAVVNYVLRNTSQFQGFTESVGHSQFATASPPQIFEFSTASPPQIFEFTTASPTQIFEFPRTPSAARPEYFTIHCIIGLRGITIAIFGRDEVSYAQAVLRNSLKLLRTTFSGVSSYSFRYASGVLHNLLRPTRKQYSENIRFSENQYQFTTASPPQIFEIHPGDYLLYDARANIRITSSDETPSLVAKIQYGVLPNWMPRWMSDIYM